MFVPRRNIYLFFCLVSCFVLLGVRSLFLLDDTAPGFPGGQPAKGPESFKIYITGKGTVTGIKTGGLGLAVYAVEKIPRYQGQLYRIGLVVLNTTEKPKELDFNVALVNSQGREIFLEKEYQTPVTVAPREVSPGTIEIEVPDRKNDWHMELWGGCLGARVELPLRVNVVRHPME
ncbi:hypothetical protein Tfer_2344 [Thermincola ferriacetica]|uniref:DUF4352 domain-containing protein n=1 Tax=Thermincola ferriacetica TaxID=281456 RepID=A0A0L6W1N4_9FIRM|nr:hypothetical protein Tfer_2344 [Thermincola ferriacetica]